ncbi:MAG: hypothetical protein SFX18_12295 [Pirellulales bacterium]|nr:hypothetical protein [Pirellulales bacterium]
MSTTFIVTNRLSWNKTFITPGALAAFGDAELPTPYLDRHAGCDWGTVGDQDAQANDDALQHGDRLLSAYILKNGAKIWIITEGVDASGQRQSTTILLPREY